MYKICIECKKEFPLSDFYLDRKRKDGHGSYCQICHTKRTLEAYRRLRGVAYEQYGGAWCANCGEDFFEVLTLDHIEGGGTAERRETAITGKRFIYHLKNLKWPPGYQVLCHNCNALKHQHLELYIQRHYGPIVQ